MNKLQGAVDKAKWRERLGLFWSFLGSRQVIFLTLTLIALLFLFFDFIAAGIIIMLGADSQLARVFWIVLKG